MAQAQFILAILEVGVGVIFLWGFICFFCTDKIYAWKAKRGHYRKGRRKERLVIRDYGMQIISVSIAAFAVIYSAQSYQLAREEFNIKERPFLKVEPSPFPAGGYYEISEQDGGPQIRFRFVITNRGSLPAYDLKISRAIRIGNIQVGEVPGGQEEQHETVVIPPGDKLSVSSLFTVNRKEMDLAGLNVASFIMLLESGEIFLEYRVEYGGVVKKRPRPYYISYRIRYPNKASQKLEGIEGDRVR